MLYMAVCDDESDIVDKVENYLLKYGEENDVFIKVFKYYDGEDLLKANMEFDLIFLDIEMKTLNGIETAQIIRRMNMNVPIVYITNYVDYWRCAYKVHAFDFISKPFKKEDIHTVLNDFIISIREASNETVELITNDGVVIQNLNEICYFLVEKKKKIIAHTVYREYIVRENLSDIYVKLDNEQFYMAHRCCVVNLKYVETIVNNFDIIMRGGEFLPLAQKKKDEFYVKLAKQLRSKKGYKNEQ